MTINRVLMILGVLVLAVALVHLSLPRHQWKQPRVYVDVSGVDKSSKIDWVESFHSVCPQMAFVRNDYLADYTIEVTWADAPTYQRWVVTADRSDDAAIYQAEGYNTPDFRSILRDSCLAIRNDLEGRADGELSSRSAPVGRYVLSYHPANPNSAFLLDSKTGAVWELSHQTWSAGGRLGKIPYREFDRVSVEGLYTGAWAQEVSKEAIRQGSGTEAEKKSSFQTDEDTWKAERDRENALDHR